MSKEQEGKVRPSLATAGARRRKFVNLPMLLRIIGLLLLIEAAMMLLPVICELICADGSVFHFLFPFALTAAAGFGLVRLRPQSHEMGRREAILLTALTWVILSLFGMLPFIFAGTHMTVTDAFFETMSGFTTTGATILGDVEALSHASMLWRCLTHWVGGMGVLVFMLIVLPLAGGQTIFLMRAESPGPAVSKMSPHMRDTATILYAIYFGLTVLQMILLLIGGMPFFDAICVSLGTAGTGGFSIKADSFASYSPYLQTVTTVFMALFGVNFSIYFFLLQKKFDLAFKNTELRWYVGIILFSIAMITANILPMYPDFHAAIHHAAFSVSSVITTTGFGTENFDLWPEFSRVILVFLMIVGASAGSTGGGLKVSRLVILVRAAQVEVRRLIRPRTVKVMRIDGKPVGQDTVRAVSGYLILYVLICMVSVLLVSLDGFDGSTTVTAVLATFNNIGPGLGLVCPAGNFAMFSPLAKVVLCLDMLFGRLEIYPMLVLLLPSTWSKKN